MTDAKSKIISIAKKNCKVNIERKHEVYSFLKTLIPIVEPKEYDSYIRLICKHLKY